MAAMKPGNNLDQWRNFFRTCSSSDIFDIIEHGIMVAASDCPQEFMSRRDRIAETLFSSKLIKCVGCDRVELCVPSEERKVDEECKVSGGSKDIKVGSGSDDRNGEMNPNQIESNYSYRDAEALTDEIEEESQIFEEILRIKEILENSKDEAGSLVFDSLRRLELIPLSVEILKATEIGKAVNAVRKHSSTDIRSLARTLIEGWKVMVDEWMSVTAALAGGLEGGTPESLNPSVVDEEEGLPSPPLDDFAFFANPNTSMEPSQFFDGLDDDLNPRNCDEFNKNTKSGRKLRVERDNIPNRRQQLPAESVTPLKCKKEELTKKEATMNKQATLGRPNKPSVVESGYERHAKLNSENKACFETKLQKKSELASQRPPLPRQNKTRYSDEDAVQLKLEATKRKLQESYQQAQIAKRQRTIQVVELHDLPKQGIGHRNPHVRPGNHNGNHNRRWTNGRC